MARPSRNLLSWIVSILLAVIFLSEGAAKFPESVAVLLLILVAIGVDSFKKRRAINPD